MEDLPKNTEDTLREWDLFHAYGKFNIEYESLIDSIRESIICLVRLSYDIKEEYPEDISESMVDRPLKIILSEATSASLIKYYKGLLFEFSEETLLSLNKKESVLSFNKKEEEIIKKLYQKILNANELRNKIIHSTWSMWKIPKIFNTKENNISLFSKMGKVVADGYGYKSALYKLSDFDTYNDELEKLEICVNEMKRFIRTGKLNIALLSENKELLSENQELLSENLELLSEYLDKIILKPKH